MSTSQQPENHTCACGSGAVDGEGVSRPDRRQVLGGTLAAASVIGLAACGGGSGSDSNSNSNSKGGGQQQSGPVSVPVADVPEGGGVVLADKGVVVTQPKKGEYKAFGVVCPHAGCNVSNVKAGQIICPCHGSTFDVNTGQPTGGPATSGLPTKTATVSGSNIQVS